MDPTLLPPLLRIARLTLLEILPEKNANKKLVCSTIYYCIINSTVNVTIWSLIRKKIAHSSASGDDTHHIGARKIKKSLGKKTRENQINQKFLCEIALLAV